MFLIIKLGYVASVFFLSPFGLICGMLCSLSNVYKARVMIQILIFLIISNSGVKLAIKYARTSTYRHFYFNRIVHIYNAICSVITLSDSYYTIQCKVTDYLWSYFNSHFNPHNTCTFHLICPCNSCHASGLYI